MVAKDLLSGNFGGVLPGSSRVKESAFTSDKITIVTSCYKAGQVKEEIIENLSDLW